MKPIILTFAFSIVISSWLPGAATFVNGGFNDNAAAYLVWPGYSGSVGGQGVATNPPAPTGWTVGGGSGINSDAVIATDSIAGEAGIGGPVNPFIDNGAETDAVLLLQGVAFAAQTVVGFTIGQEYILSFNVNARNCCGDVPEGQLSIGGAIAIPFTPITPVGGDANYNVINVPFTAPATELEFRVDSRAAAGGDATLLLDNFSLTVVPEPSTVLTAMLGLGLIVRRRRSASVH